MRFKAIQSFLLREETIALLFLLLIAYLAIVFNYQNPPHLFWDENYHIASAQKYLNHIYFMEPHPPLGKMLIALGEKIVNANAIDNQFIGTDYGTNLPDGFSFAGYRLFPVLLGWLTAPLLYLIFLFITRRYHWSLLLSFLYVFDNALVVHMRSAMLDSTLLFFCSATILAFLMAIEWKENPKRFLWASILFGVAFACVMTTKLFGLILVLLVPALIWALRGRWNQVGKFLLVSGISFAVVYIGVWHAHFTIGSTVNPQLPDNGYYQASEQYKLILQAGKSWSPLAFPVMLRDSVNFVGHYQNGVPRLDLCKADENGSPFFYWPFGARSINYRWETPDGNSYRYLYLQVNPVVWGVALLALIVSCALLIGNALLPVTEKLRNGFLLSTFTGIYVAYMGAISQIDRVMYLYHYFIPFLFTLLLVGVVFMELRRIGPLVLTEDRKTAALLALAVLVFGGYQVYRPFTYYKPMTDDQVQLRSINPYWELHCVNCPKESPVAVPGD